MFNRYILLFLLLVVCAKAQAIRTIDYTIDISKYLGEHTMFYEDKSNKLTISQILDSNIVFHENHSEVPNFGLTSATYWLKFKITNNSDFKNLLLNIENPLLSYVTLYIIRPNMPIDSIHINGDDNNTVRAIEHQFYTFHLALDKGATATYIIKTQSNSQLLVPLLICDRDSVINQLLTFDLRTGIFIGLMLAMLLYNLFLYISARDKQYLFYVNYIFWVTIAQVAILGLFHKYVCRDNLILQYIVPFAGAMSGIASVLFLRSFLNVKFYDKRFQIYLTIIIVLDLVAILLLFIDVSLAYRLVNIVAGIGSLVVLYVAVRIQRKGNKEANLFLIAWGIFLSSVIIFVLKDIGIIKYSQFTTYIVQIGVSIEALLLSFALGNKLNVYRREKEVSQIREFTALRENERLIREQNEILEIKIEERTQELQLANQSLEDAMDELKGAQSQLVQSEKMASLGQLTAGVAHEINNPINFVTSNVAPLKRDLAMVWDAFSFIENISLNESLDFAEKKIQIDSYKTELDIDYLKSEIDFLLQGMHDGASRTAEIVKSLRIFSRVDEDVVMRADVNLGIDSTLVIINSLMGDNNIQLEKHLSNIPLIECYPGKLNQVFLNILSNAIYAIEKKFHKKEGGKLRIDSNFLENQNILQIIIEDNGIGIPDNIVNKIFEPFFTTKDVGEGTGLGMSIAYNTIAKHNGEIKVDSVVGERTVFVINLPVAQPV